MPLSREDRKRVREEERERQRVRAEPAALDALLKLLAYPILFGLMWWFFHRH